LWGTPLHLVPDGAQTVVDWASILHSAFGQLEDSIDRQSFIAALSRELSELTEGPVCLSEQSDGPPSGSAGVADEDRLSPDRAIEQLCAQTLSALLTAEHLRTELDDAQAEIAHLQDEVLSNRDIGVAVGILMTRQQISRDEALNRMRQARQQRQPKLGEVAEHVIATGRLPAQPPRPRPWAR
jgi:hypothetical protein